MFVQIIEGKVREPASFVDMERSWDATCRPGAVGFLGSTGGVTADGTTFIAARFRSAEDAAANAARPEQSVWWSEVSPLFVEPPSFRETTDVTEWGGGGSDDAGFVQVLKGRVADRARLEEIYDATVETMQRVRRDILGGVVHWFDDESVEVVYFSSEEAARAGEQLEMPPELAALGEEMMAMMQGVEYLDLPAPTLR
ncbi:MAG: hypothetical protein MUF83_01600 [Acidimicrobiales bacterium]|jgi:hypothetical protein|nr:hypothetical protein [Acidimicrobiales bacterium]